MQKYELTGRIVLPGDRQYSTARKEFNTLFNRYPCIVVFAQDPQDVINAVLWAREKNIPFRIRSGRHNYEGLSVVDNGLVIDVSDMKRAVVNRRGGTATVQTGLRDFQLAETPGAQGQGEKY